MAKKTERRYTTQEAAEALGITEGRVRQLIAAGVIPAERFGAHAWVITETGLRAARERKTSKGPARRVA